MNKENDYKPLLDLANENLKKHNVELRVSSYYNDFSLQILTKDENGDVVSTEDFAGGYYEDEMFDLVNEAWVYAQEKVKRLRKNERLPKLDHTLRLFCESVQEITLRAWPIIYADNKYDQDSREVLDTIREWAWEFEYWWIGHDQDYLDTHDYFDELLDFTDRKCLEYIKGLGVETEPEQKKWIVRITRVEKYEGDVLVTATSQKEAEEKVADAWQDDEYQWLYEDMTECINCDSQTYEAKPAADGDHWDFDLTNYEPRG